MDLPQNYSIVYSSQQIADEVRRLGAEISPWAQQVSKGGAEDLVVIPVLRGGIFFFADLVRHICASVEISPIHASVYQLGKNNVQLEESKVAVDGISVKGRAVLLVDDVCDSGKTLAILKPLLISLGATEVRCAVLIHRKLQQEHAFQPDWVGFIYTGPEWFVGYGMDDQSRWRNLPSIYVIGQGS